MIIFIIFLGPTLMRIGDAIENTVLIIMNGLKHMQEDTLEESLKRLTLAKKETVTRKFMIIGGIYYEYKKS